MPVKHFQESVAIVYAAMPISHGVPSVSAKNVSDTYSTPLPITASHASLWPLLLGDCGLKRGQTKRQG